MKWMASSHATPTRALERLLYDCCPQFPELVEYNGFPSETVSSSRSSQAVVDEESETVDSRGEQHPTRYLIELLVLGLLSHHLRHSGGVIF